MELLTIRHGETEWNLEGREMGQLDSPLTELGLRQARAVADRLAGLRFEIVYSSDLGRAVQTAEIIAVRCERPLKLDATLRERHMGIFQGLTVPEMREEHPEERRSYEEIGFEYVIPGGESARQRRDRGVEAMTTIAERHPRETVVVVTHGGFLMGFFEHVLNIAPGNGGHFQRHNAGLSSFEYEDRHWRLVTWNDTSHLRDLGSIDDPMLAGRGREGGEVRR